MEEYQEVEVELNYEPRGVFEDFHNRDQRWAIIVAHRRCGKTVACINDLIFRAIAENKENAQYAYLAPYYSQSKNIAWQYLQQYSEPVLAKANQSELWVELVNGARIKLYGADNPDSLRGLYLDGVVLDEYADMKPQVFEQIIRPALADVRGGALFIGTPKGRNHFYEMFQYANAKKDVDWKAFHYTSFDNPLLHKDEIEAARLSMSSFAFKQEFMAAFEAASSDLFKEEWIKFDAAEPKEGSYYIAVDLAGFEDVASQTMNKKKLLDETAIAVVKVSEAGWWVADLIHGRWDIKQTANEILKAVSKYEPNAVGIEKGSLKNAVMPYLTDLMRRYNKYFRIDEVTHGNRKKTDRVVWALQGRFEHGQILLNEGSWNNTFVDQLLNFPNTQMHDDLPDALAYIDQLAVTSYMEEENDEEWQPLDIVAGF